ncbi:MAG: hypothetical protein COV72_06815 [Candidatus Omnitrophica bacterium CG11_big_fil_rev_8_21_14_0_20_42_13]|uniref:Uncharacterized protein n=1 Tax=Candidatus Ghiorseimicrobium undicola TaxID=1974746 RepID=A0A2H0LWJ4_9BACT|nr:MAG: hypothetical protein COV72_06815 [Candidatus Omnitrophica bacterium CG11_big_fil_rev_8_21_14_0_20_42_13]
MASILKLKRHNEKKEIDFELRYLKSLSVKQRFNLMRRKTKEIVDLLEKSGHRRAFKIVKRA